jgi:glutathione S-transferase
MGKYQLFYFPIRGRAEPVRLLFKDNAIDYEDVVCDYETWYTHWKPKMQFGQVPLLKDNDFQLFQSNAILRYLGRKHGLYGRSLEDAAVIDMINDSVEDLRVKYTILLYKNYEAGKDEYITALPAQFQLFENVLTKNVADKSGCAVGGERSFADYNLTDMLDAHLVLAPKCLDDFPTLRAYYKQNISRPAIAEYRESSLFKTRPINANGKQ